MMSNDVKVPTISHDTTSTMEDLLIIVRLLCTQWLVKALDCTTPEVAKNARLKAAHNVNLPCSESG